MKIYSQTIDLSKTTPQNFYVPPHSKFKLGVKLVQSIDFAVKLDGAALESDGEIDGFKTFSLESANPGNTTYVVEAVNGQKVKILQTTTNSTVFDVEGGGSGGVSQEYVDTKVQDEATARQNDVSSLAGRIPTKTSQLSNDSGFLTHEGTIANADHASTANTANTANNANTANSVAWSGVQSKPTTLEGYGITDAAKKTELDSLAAVVGNANTQLEEIA